MARLFLVASEGHGLIVLRRATAMADIERAPEVEQKPHFGESNAALEPRRRSFVADLLLLAGVAGAAVAVFQTAREWGGELRPAVEIDLSPSALPQYMAFSLVRGLIAYGLSLLFTLAYGYWAAKDRVAERALVPLLDILQSIPVLGFMPGVVLALVAAFPHYNIGLELAAILMIFTGQAWNMTFSFYQSLKSVPQDQQEVARVYCFTWWERFRWVELPFSAIGLVWNSMMSMAGGWFFLMISEAFQLGDKDFRLPGLGSYMSLAVAKGDGTAMLLAVVAMAVMIVGLDQFLWRPVVVWSQKFRMEEGGEAEQARSWFLQWLRRSRILGLVERAPRPRGLRKPPLPKAARRPLPVGKWVSAVLMALLVVGSILGAWQLVVLLAGVPGHRWLHILLSAALTLLRVLVSTALGTAWALPAGLAIGLSPRLSRVLQPVVQVVASFPAPMLFPAVIAGLHALGITLGVGSIVLMLLGTQWYILFNVIAGAMAIPADLREAARSYDLRGWRRFRALYFPSVYPYLLTGWVTAAGGAWNASIVSEYVTMKGTALATLGLGAEISRAASAADFQSLAAAVGVMALVVVAFNRAVWRPLHGLAERRFALSK